MMNKLVQLASKNYCHYRLQYCFALETVGMDRDACDLFDTVLDYYWVGKGNHSVPIRCDECKERWPNGVWIGGK